MVVLIIMTRIGSGCGLLSLYLLPAFKHLSDSRCSQGAAFIASFFIFHQPNTAANELCDLRGGGSLTSLVLEVFECEVGQLHWV